MVTIKKSQVSRKSSFAEANIGVESGDSLSGMGTIFEKPKSNIFTLLLIISLIFILVGIYLIGYELNIFYGVEFGGLFKAGGGAVSSTE
ncbi:MAG: hypothetical protein AAB019_10870 [Planctomycetota bacterium]